MNLSLRLSIRIHIFELACPIVVTLQQCLYMKPEMRITQFYQTRIIQKPAPVAHLTHALHCEMFRAIALQWLKLRTASLSKL
jgi:hypothetical protein